MKSYLTGLVLMAAAAAFSGSVVAQTAVKTNQQKNAVRVAKDYLSTQGFSRLGLIRQLSSESGEGFSLEDATIAVDSLHANWDQQAVRVAKDYLKTQGFSCRGLIRQLSSSSGESFTFEQATFGAQQAGACD